MPRKPGRRMLTASSGRVVGPTARDTPVNRPRPDLQILAEA